MTSILCHNRKKNSCLFNNYLIYNKKLSILYVPDLSFFDLLVSLVSLFIILIDYYYSVIIGTLSIEVPWLDASSKFILYISSLLKEKY